ncbi:phospholipase [bacterium]|nr:MAG: phospholipase [bacterium]
MTVTTDYLLSLPEGYDADKSKKWPLVLFLHGAGERGNDLEKNRVHGPFKELAKGRKIPAIVIAPQCPTGDSWSSERMQRALQGLLDDAERRYRVDRDREYLTGLSMGGFGTWALAMRTSNRFTALAPICGGGDVSKVTVLKGVPIWTVHGDADPTVPVQGTRDLVVALRAAGSKVRYDELPGVQHDSWTQTYAKDEFWDWLLSQKR